MEGNNLSQYVDDPVTGRQSVMVPYAIPWTVAYQAPPFLEFSRQEYWAGVEVPLYEDRNEEKPVSRVNDAGRGMTASEGPTGGIEPNKSKTIKLNKYPFIIQFLWTPTDPLQREIDRQTTLRKEEEERIAREKAECCMSFPGVLVVKNPPANAGDLRDACSVPG